MTLASWNQVEAEAERMVGKDLRAVAARANAGEFVWKAPHLEADVGKQPIFVWIPGSSSIRMSREDGPCLVQVPIHDRYGKPIRLIQIGASASDEQRLDYVAKAAPHSVSVCCLATRSLSVNVRSVGEQDLNRACSASSGRNVKRCLGPRPLTFVWISATIQHSEQHFVTVGAVVAVKEIM